MEWKRQTKPGCARRLGIFVSDRPDLRRLLASTSQISAYQVSRDFISLAKHNSVNIQGKEVF